MKFIFTLFFSFILSFSAQAVVPVPVFDYDNLQFLSPPSASGNDTELAYNKQLKMSSYYKESIKILKKNECFGCHQEIGTSAKLAPSFSHISKSLHSPYRGKENTTTERVNRVKEASTNGSCCIYSPKAMNKPKHPLSEEQIYTFSKWLLFAK